jgi:hypothetical protein
VTDAVQFIGSMVAWAWNGEPYSAANVFVAVATAPAASPRLVIAPHEVLPSAARYCAARLAESTAAFGPGANVTASASAAVFACQKCSATTATPFGIANAPITPGRPAIDVASNFSTVPPNAGAWRTAA